MGMYLNSDKALQRLRNDWKTHGSIIVAVDYDSTLVPYLEEEYIYEQQFEQVKQLVRDLTNLGCTIIINTASSEDRYASIKEELEKMDIKWALFNESPKYIPNIGHGAKVYANAYLDDRAGLAEVFGHLTQLVTEQKLKRAQQKILNMTAELANC